MKKVLTALAIAGSFCGYASAQSAVNIYGIVDMGFVKETGGSTGSFNKLTSGTQSGTRLGFKGTEELGANMKALFVLETGIAADAGGFNQGALAFGRQNFVGLQGDFGTVTLGRQYTPYFLTLNGADPFASGMAGAAINMMASSGTRMNNAIKYATPLIDGFSADLAYGFGEQANSTSKGRIISGSIGYAAEPVTIRLAHHNKRNLTDTDTAKNTLLAGTWDFQVAKLHLAYASNRGIDSSPYTWNAANSPTPTSTLTNPFGFTSVMQGSTKSNDFLIGASAPFENHTFLVTYIRKDDRDTANRDANLIGLGYTYAFTKRTNIYAAWARINNKNLASYTVGNNSEVGSGDKAFNLGIRHTF